MKKIVCIVGSTGVGKTDLAVSLAQKFNGMLISADSVQVYKGLDIVSGKDLPKDTQFSLLPQFSKNGLHTGYYTFERIRIFLLDVVKPSFSFSVSHFQKLATQVIDYIQSENKVPIVVGGTGLYIKALIEGIDVAVKPDLLLRKKLDEFNVEELQNELKRIDSNKFNILNNSDMSNRRRLVRAIEIIVNSKKQKAKSKKKIEFESLVIGLTCEKEVLKQRIDKRVEKRLENGALSEVEGLFKDYVNLSPQVKNANGYKQLFQFFNKKITFDEAIYRWKISEYRHAKNQMTWFRKYGNVEWFDITTKKFDKQVENRLKKFLS